MLYLQVLINGLVLGGLYACIAAGFSLVWGVLNVINILREACGQEHGSYNFAYPKYRSAVPGG